MFDRLQWSDDRVVLDSVTFLLEGKARRGSKDGLWLHKSKPIIDEYERLFADYPALHVQNLLELGIWKGGSIALWMQLLEPAKCVAIDLLKSEDAPLFARFVEERGLGDRLRTYWGTDQSDAGRLREIVDAEFTGTVDLVIDDASHAYAPTKSSFETLFPLVAEGGLYVIEDWPWQFSAEYLPDFDASEPGLVPLITDLAVLSVGVPGLVRRVDVRKAFIAVERGGLGPDEASAGIAGLWRRTAPEPIADRWREVRRLKRRILTAVRGR